MKLRRRRRNSLFFLRRQNIQIYVNLINKMILFCFSFHFFRAVEFYPAFICVTKPSRLFFEKMINPLLNLSTGAAVLFTMLLFFPRSRIWKKALCKCFESSRAHWRFDTFFNVFFLRNLLVFCLARCY